VRHLDERYFSPDVDWAEGPDTAELAEALRSALDEGYAEASDEAMDDALANVLDSMSPAEGFNFASALNRISKGAGQLVSDPAFVAVAQTALPIVAGAAGTALGGPVGGALAGKLGSLAASALQARPAPPVPPAPAAPVPAAPAPPAPVPAPPVPPAPPAPAVAAVPAAPAPPRAAPVSPLVAGSAAAAQGLVLTQQPEVLRSLLATALGQQGRQTVSGIPAAQVLGTLSQIFGKAAADADELMYLRQQSGSAESISADVYADSADELYNDLIGADNQELAEAVGWDWADR
jgi:hypothetical protein